MFKRTLAVVATAILSTAAGAAQNNLNMYPTSPFYLGIFGGADTFSTHNITQQGTAFFPPSSGGPLDVNAHGSSSNASTGVVGAHLGYQWLAVNNPSNSFWQLVPAAEIEGYYVGGTLNGSGITNITNRLPQHDFKVSYPMSTGVFLVNAILSLGEINKLHPYLGIGIGTAVVSITGADSTQTTPAEPGINHYNSNTNASDWTFAFQTKIGLLFNLTARTSIFIEYRFLQLSPTQYTFGSTQYATHVPTTNWNVNLGQLRNNMGVIGINWAV